MKKINTLIIPVKYFQAVIFSIFLIGVSCSTTGTHRTVPPAEVTSRESLRKDRSETTASRILYGKASYYADKFHGRKTASGEIFDMNLPTAAHRTFPFGTTCRVTNISNQKSVIVKINDRGPFIEGRIIDLSKAAAKSIGAIQDGVVDVKIEILSLPQE